MFCKWYNKLFLQTGSAILHAYALYLVQTGKSVHCLSSILLYWSNMATLLQNNMDTQFNEQKEDGRLYPGRTTPEVETASFSCMLVYHNKKRTQDARECHVCKPTITCSNVIVSANTPQDKIKWEENHATCVQPRV